MAQSKWFFISVLYQNASTSRILEPSPQGLISSMYIQKYIRHTLIEIETVNCKLLVTIPSYLNATESLLNMLGYRETRNCKTQ